MTRVGRETLPNGLVKLIYKDANGRVFYKIVKETFPRPWSYGG